MLHGGSRGGAVLRIEQVIADRYCAAILIDFTAPEGTVLDQDYYAFDETVSATSKDGVTMQTWGVGWERYYRATRRMRRAAMPRS